MKSPARDAEAWIDEAGRIARAGSFDHMRLLFGFAVIVTHSIRFMEGRGYLDPMDLLFGVKSTWIYGLGDLAVDGFFALSGFLISMSWARSPSLGLFLRNRVLRIYPGFAVSSLLCVLVVAPIAAPSVAAFLGELSIWRTIGHIVRLKPPEATVFVGTPHPTLNTSMWSISHEFRCYLLVAAVGLAVPFRMRRWFWAGLLAACVAVFGSGWQMPEFPLRDTILGGGSDEARLVGCFASGALLFHLMPWYRRIRWALAPVSAALLVCLFNEATLPFAIPLLLAPFFILVGLWALPGRILPRMRVDLSYGVYLYAWPIQKLILHVRPDVGLAVHVLLTALLACLAAWGSWTFVEKPMLRFKR